MQYKLPRIPIKNSDRRKTNFEDKFGEGAVELDALEALHPGEFKRIIEENILKYFDTGLAEEVNDNKEEAQSLVKMRWEAAITPHTNELDAIEAELHNITASYEEKLKNLQVLMDEEIFPYKERLEELQKIAQDDIEELKSDIQIPDLPQSDLRVDDDDWLFDSKRDYMEQLRYYRRVQTKKPATKKPRAKKAKKSRSSK